MTLKSVKPFLKNLNGEKCVKSGMREKKVMGNTIN